MLKSNLEKQLNIVQSNNGTLFYNNQRMIMTPSHGIGTLRKNLIETIGTERAKTFLIQYGWNLGASDAALVMEQMKGAPLEEIIMEGTKIHTLMGHADVQGKIIELDPENNRFHIEGTWVSSYEAQEHIRLFGLSKEASCHILVGYASGYTSEILGTKVIYKEYRCQAMGHPSCKWEGKPLSDWGGHVDDELGFFKENNMIHELEKAYEQIVIERDNLDQTFVFHKKLMELIMLGKDLHSIAEMVNDFLRVPIVISNQNWRTLAKVGLTEVETEELYKDLNIWLENHLKDSQKRKKRNKDPEIFSTKLLSSAEDKHYLVSPIIVRQKLAGFCTLILKCEEVKEIYGMILEKTAASSSLYLLSQQIAIETEQRSRGYFLEQILSKQLTKEEILKWGFNIGIDLEASFYIVVLNQVKKNQTVIKKEQIEFNEKLIGTLSVLFSKKQVRYLIGQRSDNIVILIQSKCLKEQGLDIKKFFEGILEDCQTLYRPKKFKIGTSMCATTIETAYYQYDEALAAFQMANQHRQIFSFHDLGAVGILIQAGNESMINRYIENLLGRLMEYDKKKGAETIKTLYVYISNGGNFELTSCSLALSISGLRYRLQKIESLLESDIRNPHVYLQLYFAIQLLIVYGMIDIEL
jgi:PucR family transcriptional regulator, purine catabolism regulatory protein